MSFNSPYIVDPYYIYSIIVLLKLMSLAAKELLDLSVEKYFELHHKMDDGYRRTQDEILLVIKKR